MSKAERARHSASRRIQTEASAVKVSLLSRIKRLLLQGIVTTGVLLVLAGAARGGLYLMDLQVERIAISGAVDNVAIEDIQALVAPRLKAGFLAADLDGIRERLEAMPWIYRANVRRRWPDAVVIQIEEQRPIARWGIAGFLNHEGEYFPGEMGDRWQQLARLEGPEGSEAAMMQHYQTLEGLLAGTGLQVVWLGQDDVGQVSAELDNGTLLTLGSDLLIQRVRRFVQLYREHLSTETVVRVDLRYEHGAAVQLLEPQLAMNSVSTSTQEKDTP